MTALLALSTASSARATTYAYDGNTGNFSTDFAPSLGSTAPTTSTADIFTFGAATYTATDDLTNTLNANSLTFSNTGPVTLARGGAGTNNSITLGGTTPAINLNNTAGAAGLVTNALDVVLTANITINGAGDLTNSGVISGAFSLTKASTGTLILNAANTYALTTTANSTAISAGTLVSANPQSLGTGRIGFTGTAVAGTVVNTGTLDLATDGGDATNNVSIGTGLAATIASDVKTGSVGINHTLGTLAFGNSQLNIVRGGNVTSGAPSITFSTVNLSAGGTTPGTATFNPTTANLIIVGSVTPSSASKTLALDGTSTGNQITGNINNSGTTIITSLTKSNTSTWTITGANTFTGPTAVTGGILSAAGTGTNKALGVTTSIAINGGGTLLLSTANQVNTAAPITLGTTAPSTGILNVAAGANQGTAATKVNGVTPTTGTTLGLGTLTLNNTATLAYNGVGTTLVFGLFTANNGSVLNITGYTNATATANGQNSGGTNDDRLVFSGTLAPVASFSFNGRAAGVGVTEIPLDGGFYEVAFTAVPEPSTWAALLLGAGVLGFTQRRRAQAWLGPSAPELALLRKPRRFSFRRPFFGVDGELSFGRCLHHGLRRLRLATPERASKFCSTYPTIYIEMLLLSETDDFQPRSIHRSTRIPQDHG